MTQDQVLLAILAGLIVVDVGVAIWAALRARRRSRSRPVAATEDVPIAAADVEAFVAGVLPDSPGPVPHAAAASSVSDEEEGVVAPGAGDVITPGRRQDSTPPDWRAGLADPATWSRAIREESARLARFGRPVTVVMAELPHLDDLGAALGPDMADRVARETARLLVAQGRKADWIAWFPGARYGVLLLETDEEKAAGYVKRVRAVTDDWLESVGLSIRLSLGWASPTDGDVRTAAVAAERRMHLANRGPEVDGDPSTVGSLP